MTEILTEGSRSLIAQGLMGFLLFLAGLVIWYMWTEIKEERARCTVSQAEILKLGAEIAHSNSEVARSLEERNRLTAEISATNSKLSTAIEHLGQILELQHDRVLELLREIKAK
jgi:hypothetical protein